MVRYFLSCAALFVCLCSLPGCGGGAKEAEFQQSAAQTSEEIKEAEDYEKMMAEQDAINK